MNRLKAAWDILTKRYAAGSNVPTTNNIATGKAMFINGNLTWIDDDYAHYVSDGYSANDVVYSIAQITSEKIKLPSWSAYRVKDEGSLKQLHIEEKKMKAGQRVSYKKMLDLRTKALELYTQDGRLNELLKYPNETESFGDLVAHSSISKMITGNRYIQGVILDGGLDKGKPQELHLLPPQFMSIINDGKHPMRSVGYQLNCGTIIQISKEDVLHDKYFNPDWSNTGSHLYGQAPLKAALMTLTNDNSGTASSTKSFQNMGPDGVLYTDDDRLSGDQSLEQAAAIKKKFKQEYTGIDNSKKIVVSGYKVGFQEMGLSPVDLNIINQQKWNLVKFCNVWNFPHLLLLQESSTYNNLTMAERALTSRCAMPLLTSFRNNFNRKLHTDWGYKGKNIIADFDQTCFTELQQDMTETVNWISKCWWIPPAMAYELQNLDIPDYLDMEMLQKIYVPSGYTPIDQLKDNTDELLNGMTDEEDNPRGRAADTD